MRQPLSPSGYPSIFCVLALLSCHCQRIYPEGGYPYPDDLTGKDTLSYRYAIRDIESRQDSMFDACSYEDWESTDEPNLSLRPMPTDVFRLVYGESLDATLYIIRLTPTHMIVRIGTPTDYYLHLPDTNLLTPLDRTLVRILEYNFPVEDTTRHRHRRRYLDSMGGLYPQLFSRSYYVKVWNKEHPHSKPWWNFTSKSIALKPGEFQHFVSLINQSDYWQLPIGGPPHEAAMDGCSYSLEANTTDRYNFVQTGGIPDTGSFAKACQALVDFAGIKKEVYVSSPIQLEVDTGIAYPEVHQPRRSHRVKKPPPN